MRQIFSALLISLGLAASVQTVAAQPAPPKQAFALPPESITVTATKPSDALIRSFVEGRSAPTHILNMMARWRRGICPLTVGLGDKYATYVTHRIRDVAAAVGAPVNADPACKPNIEVVFTTTPQDFMDKVRKNGPAFLGYYQTMSQADDLAKVTHPIQGWYITESLDRNASPQIDTGRCGGRAVNTLPLSVTSGELGADMQDVQGTVSLNVSCAMIMASSASRLGNSYDSGFRNVLIVAEPAKLTDYEVGSLADYITLLALSQPVSLDNCQDLLSISNLLAKDCASVSNKITDGDLGFLQALYKMSNGNLLGLQQDYISYEMKKILVTDKGGQ